MQYSKRDLRAADMLALIFVGLGMIILIVGLSSLLADDAGKSAKSGQGSRQVLFGTVLLVLGAAVNVKVRQLIRNKGVETPDYTAPEEQS